ncbi:hypothetical protein DUI87_25668 [Hirundo rustica rustica]|uniref:Uncharacterized protein n=1 Tax=Hirundo rustica rustica TaxID=333673 RepID=A0A3M0J9E7_HIRRU|nr:hypothetical protein DUI87_25668 [Hirundo rustica rustica]
MEENRDLQWTKEATRAFDQLKKALMSAPALGLPDSTEPREEAPLAPSAPGEEAKEEQPEPNEHNSPAVLTAQPEHSEPVSLEEEHEQLVSSEMPCQTQGELFPAQDQEEQLRQQVEEAEENGQNIQAEPQAELPEAQSDLMAVKSQNLEDMRSVLDEKNLPQQRGDQQNLVSVSVATTSLNTSPLSCSLENINKQVQAEWQETESRMKAREKKLKEEMKTIREKLNLLIQNEKALKKKVDVLASHLEAHKGFHQRIGNKEPQGWREAQQLAQPGMVQLERVRKKVAGKRIPWDEIYTGSSIEAAAAAAAESPKGASAARAEKRNPGRVFTSSRDRAAAQQEEIKEDSLEPRRRVVNLENPKTKYIELEISGSRSLNSERKMRVMKTRCPQRGGSRRRKEEEKRKKEEVERRRRKKNKKRKKTKKSKK